MAPVPPATKIRIRPTLRGHGADPWLWQDGWVSEHSGYPGAPPGWYKDPAGGPGQRWWDGYSWSEATVLPQQAPPPPWAGAPQAPPAPWTVASERLDAFTTTQRVDDEQRLVPVARLAVAMPGIYFLVGLVL